MPSYSKNDVILVVYPFTDLSTTKVRPAVVVNAVHGSPDLIIVPLTSRVLNLQDGEFILNDWLSVGLRVQTVVKRGVSTIHPRLVIRRLGSLSATDASQLE